ncbi:hypothetical protein G6F22_019177 [Rhizopus arrhizus]|nr:hypothetical protein G6F22_019177 [Rhizopus arrhizus]
MDWNRAARLAAVVLEQHGQVQPAVIELFAQVARQAFDQVQPHVGIALGNRGVERLGQHGCRGGGEPHADHARQPGFARCGDGVFSVAQRQPRLAQESRAGGCGHDAGVRAHQQPSGQFAFQAADLLA